MPAVRGATQVALLSSGVSVPLAHFQIYPRLSPSSSVAVQTSNTDPPAVTNESLAVSERISLPEFMLSPQVHINRAIKMIPERINTCFIVQLYQ